MGKMTLEEYRKQHNAQALGNTATSAPAYGPLAASAPVRVQQPQTVQPVSVKTPTDAVPATPLKTTEKKSGVLDWILNGMKDAAAKAEADPYAGYRVDPVSEANAKQEWKPTTGETREHQSDTGTGGILTPAAQNPGLATGEVRTRMTDTGTGGAATPASAKPGYTGTPVERYTDTATGGAKKTETPNVDVMGILGDIAGWGKNALGKLPESHVMGGGQMAALEQERTALQEEYEDALEAYEFAISPQQTVEANERLKAAEEALITWDREHGADSSITRRENADWEGRDELLAEYRRLSRIQYLNPAQAARREEVLRLLEEGDRAAGNPVQDYTFGDRLGSTIGGALQGIGSQLSNAFATAADLYSRGVMSANPGSPVYGVNDENPIADKLDPIYDYAERLGGDAAETIERAKGGLGKLGQAGVDIWKNLVEIGFDMGVSTLTGGSALVPMAARVFGGSALEAKQKGAGLGQQVLYGGANVGIELFTEKMFGLLSPYGKGTADDITEALVGKFAKTDFGRTVLRLVFGGAGEGVEEGMSWFLSPLAERIIDSDALKSFFTRFADPEERAEALYEMIIGAAVGVLGGAAGLVNGANAEANAKLREADVAQAEAEITSEAQQPRVMPTSQTEAQPVNENDLERKTPVAPSNEAATPQSAEPTAPLTQGSQEAPEANRAGEERAERQVPEAPKNEKLEETLDALLPQTKEQNTEQTAEKPVEAAEAKIAEDHESVPPSTQESTTGEAGELNSGSRADEAAEEKAKARAEAAELDTKEKAAQLQTEFEQDPVNVQRFQDGQGTYSQYDIQDRLAILQELFPEEDYYISEGNIVKGRKYTTTTGQSEAYGDKRTGSNFAKPKARPEPKSNVPAPKPQSSTFDPDTAKPGDVLHHKIWGDVTVTKAGDGTITVQLPDGSTKTVVSVAAKSVFTPVQKAAESGTMDSGENIPTYNNETGGNGNEGSVRGDSAEEHRPVDGRTKGQSAGGVRENGEAARGKKRSVSQRVQGRWGKDAEIRGASSEEEHKQTALAKKIAGSSVEVWFVKPDSNTETHEKNKFGKESLGACNLSESGKVRIFVSLNNPGGSAGITATIVHESIHARFAVLWGDGKNSGAAKIFLQFAKKNRQYAQGVHDIIVNIADAYYDISKNDFGLPDLDESSSTYRNDLIDAINGNDDFAGRLANEFFAFISSGTLGEGSPAGVDMNALQQAAQQYLIDNGIVAPDAFSDTPKADSVYSAKKEATQLKDPGENKSWADSLMVQEPPAENQGGEKPGDDMTPLNEMSQEQDEKAREEAKARTIKQFGKENYDRLKKVLEKFEAWAKSYAERFGETQEDEDGNTAKVAPVLDELIRQVRSTLEGQQTVQTLREYYESLRPKEGDNRATDENYFYDGAIAEALNQFAEAEHDMISLENANELDRAIDEMAGDAPDPQILKDNYDKASEAFSLVFPTVTDRLTSKFDERTEANQETRSNAKAEKSGLKNWLERVKDAFWRIQMRPDTFFEMLGGFARRLGKTWYNISDRVKKGERVLINTRTGAKDFFSDILNNKETAKAWADIESGKTKGNVNIPGVGKTSLHYELGILKTLETNGALDHIARFGAWFANEADYLAGRHNNGRGETEGYQVRLMPEMLEQQARERLAGEEKITGRMIYDEKIKILKELRAAIKADVLSNDVAKAAYEASTKSMQFLADAINGVTLRLYGLAKALQGPNYWPMEVVGRNNQAQFENNQAWSLSNSRQLQHRKGGSGALRIRPFAEAMNNYIEWASNFVAFGELTSDLEMMTKEIGVGYGQNDWQKQSVLSAIDKYYGRKAGDWLRRYMDTLNGNAKKADGFSAKLRGNLATSSLLGNPGVVIKQGASYWNAMNILDADILFKNRLLGSLRSAKMWNKHALIKTLDDYTSILESRRSGYTLLEATRDGRSLSNRLMKLVPNWMKNWISQRDFSTVANLATACADQVVRNNLGIEVNSEEFYQKTAELLEKVTVQTQPIFDPQFRADYLRSENQYVRTLAMFRTQQSQNFNNLFQAYGELNAAKNGGTEAEVKAAQQRVNCTVAGYAISQLAFVALSSAGRLLRHKTKDYEDENGEFDYWKLMRRLGLDFLTSSAGAVWFGDVAASVAIDLASGVASKVTGNKELATGEYYALADNTISIVDDMLASLVKLARNPTVKTVKSAVMDTSQAFGFPTKNLYDMLNAVVMYGTDAVHANLGNYDDMLDMVQTQLGMSESARATQTVNAAAGYYKNGNDKRAKTLLATLDYDSAKVRSAVREAAGKAYVRGDIDVSTYMEILSNTKAEKIEETVHNKDLQRTIAALTETDPKKYEALIQSINEAKDYAQEGESKSAAAAKLILDADAGKEGERALLETYTSKSYLTAYDAASKVLDKDDVIDALLGIDSDGDSSFAQEELYRYYVDSPSSEKLVKAIWDANGWKTSWDAYKTSNLKHLDYDRIAEANQDSAAFTMAETLLKAIKSDSTVVYQKQTGDPAMYQIINGMGLSDNDTDTVVDKYVSADSKANYHTLRDAGCEPQKAFEILTAIDTDGKGTISQEELWTYYKDNRMRERLIEALWNAQGWKKNWAEHKASKNKK